MKKCSDVKPNAFSKLIGLRSVAFMIISLLILSYALIGGCNNGSGQNADALRIGKLSGAIVAAVNAEYFIKKWVEVDSENNFFLQGNIVNQLTQAEQDALNNAYQSGYFISLINPDIEDINNLHDVLGIQQLIVDNGPLDIFAVSKQLSGAGGVRYYRLYNEFENQNPRELDFERERVMTLIDWQNTQSEATTIPTLEDVSMSCDPSTSNCLTNLADGVTYTESLTIYAGTKFTFMGIEFTEDFKGTFTVTISGLSAHSVINNIDFYYFQTDYVLAPNTTGRTSGSGWPCNIKIRENDLFPRNTSQVGVNNYVINNTVAGLYSKPTVTLLESSPGTVTCQDTTLTSISHSIAGDVSYSTDEGEGVGLSKGVDYSVSTGTDCASVEVKNLSDDGPQNNNAKWVFPVFETNVATADYQPHLGWYYSAEPVTRSDNPCIVKEGDNEIRTNCLQIMLNTIVNYYSISCLPDVAPASKLGVWSLNFPNPPTPAPPTPTPTPTPCTSNSDCPVGQQCATDLMPPSCQPQQCDANMLCPAGFACVSEECQPNN